MNEQNSLKNLPSLNPKKAPPGGENQEAEVEKTNYTSDEVPLTAGLEDSTPYISTALLVDKTRELQLVQERDDALRQIQEFQEERDDALRQHQGITVAQSVHALPAGNEEEAASEATSSISPISMILVATVMVATVATLLLTADKTTLLLTADKPPTVPVPVTAFSNRADLEEQVNIYVVNRPEDWAALDCKDGTKCGVYYG
jgi:hypothetical protein